MKKLITLTLALCLLFACATALAVDVQESPDKETYRSNSLDCPMSGLYVDQVTLEDGAVRSLLHYYPEDLSFRRPVVIIAVPDDVDAPAFLEDNGWLAQADAKNFMLIALLPGEGGWQDDELAYTHAAYDYAQARYYYTNDDAAYYMIGYGKAADAVMAEAMTQADLYAGFACLGGTYANAEAMIAAAQTTESAEPGRMQSTVPVPMWIGAAEKTPEVEALINYWVAANECSTANGEVLSNAYADEIYAHPLYGVNNLNLTDNKPSKVMVSLGDRDYLAADFSDYLYTGFLFRARRQDSFQVGALRYTSDVESELGMEYNEILDDDGNMLDYFYVYVPTSVREGKYDKVPLVYVTHGASGGADEFSLRGGMVPVAEQYNFILVSTQNNNNADIWNADNDYICANYPVDTTRIYVSGQSMGCAFCLTIAENYPEKIAAVAAASLVNDYREEALARREIKNEEIQVPVFISVGYLDQHFLEGTGSMYARYPSCGEYWLNRAGIDSEWVDYDTLWTNVAHYDFSVYHDWVGLNHQGFPMFRWQRVDGKIHAYTVEEGLMFYEYMVQWSRGEDGTLYYMGIPVTAE